MPDCVPDSSSFRQGERVRIKMGAEPVGVIRYEQAGLIFVELDDPRFGDATAGYWAENLETVHA